MTVNYRLILMLLMLNTLISCNTAVGNVKSKNELIDMEKDTIIFGAGCFWCVEAVFQQLKGVVSVKPGYCNGETINPTYKEVCSGITGHNEVARVVYDTSIISYEELLEVFWKTHDPTTLNRQGNDIGTQYRSGVYCVSDEQMQLAESYKNKLNSSGIWKNPIVTEIEMLDVFYSAENYHVNYYNLNKNQPYCQFVIQPKIDKFREIFKDKLTE